MTRNDYYIAAGIVAAAWLLTRAGKENRVIRAIKNFLPAQEGFSPVPYWDVSRWSWGYGTQAPGETGRISQADALSAMLVHVLVDYYDLRRQVSRDLSPDQWAALLSFSYNLGRGNAQNLLTNINNYNDQALGVQWKKYVYAGGQVNDSLVARRNREWSLWNS